MTAMICVGIATMILACLSVGIVDRFTRIGNHLVASVVFAFVVVIVWVFGLALVVWGAS